MSKVHNSLYTNFKIYIPVEPNPECLLVKSELDHSSTSLLNFSEATHLALEYSISVIYPILSPHITLQEEEPKLVIITFNSPKKSESIIPT